MGKPVSNPKKPEAPPKPVAPSVPDWEDDEPTAESKVQPAAKAPVDAGVQKPLNKIPGKLRKNL